MLVYPQSHSAPIGPGFVGSVVTDGEGRFSVGLAPGSYKVGVRRRSGGDATGFLREGDYRADVRPETVDVPEASWLDLGDLSLRPIDPGKLAGVRNRGFQERTTTVVEGRVVGADGLPRPSYFVLAYRNPEMMGKPDAVTEVRADGTYTLFVPEGGTYSLLARPAAGGAAQPGEQIGVVAGSGTSCLEVVAEETTRGVDFMVGAGP